MITKKAENNDVYRRTWKYTESAREAWSQIIVNYKSEHPQGRILLPGYIGWSANEGSGIFDSVKNSGLESGFYDLNSRLEINFEHLKSEVNKDRNQLVLLVHYFGFMDQQYDEITAWLTENEITYVEDCAHAWLSDLVGGTCGRRGAYAFYSLHKLLPVNTGGIMVNNLPLGEAKQSGNPFTDLSYDLFQIYKVRRSNYEFLADLLKDVQGIDMLYKDLKPGICPQTLPAIVTDFDRSTLYHLMNESGYGVVSLYHTMITQLSDSNFGASEELSKKIINLPIHQDVTQEQMIAMVDKLKSVLNA